MTLLVGTIPCDQVDGAVEAARDRLAAAGRRSAAHRVLALLSVSEALLSRFLCRRTADDLDQAIEAAQEAKKLVPRGRPERRAVTVRLASALAVRNRPEDVEVALDTLRNEQAGLRPENPEHAALDAMYATLLAPQYLRFRRREDLADALNRMERALPVLDKAAAAPRTSRQVAEVYAASAASARSSLATLLMSRHGDPEAGPEDDERIRRLVEQAGELSPAVGSVGDALVRAHDLRSLETRPADEAARMMTDFNLGEISSIPGYEATMGTVGQGLRAGGRYGAGGDLRALDDGIRELEAELDTPGRFEADRPSQLATLANMYHLRARTKGLAHDPSATGDRKQAEHLARQVLGLGRGSQDEARIVLANCMLDGYRPDGPDQYVLDEVVTLLRRAISGQALAPPLRRATRSSLAEALIAKGFRDGDLEAVDEGVGLFRMIRDGYPPGTLPYAFACSRLAAGLHLRAEATGFTEDQLAAADASRRAVDELAGKSLIWAYDTATQWGDWSFRHERMADAGDAYLVAVDVLNQLVRAQLTREMSELVLRRGSYGMPARAAYALTRRGRLTEAVEALEGGRAVLLSAALEHDLVGLTAPEHEPVRQRYLQAVERLRALQDRAIQDQLATEAA
jgi:tetratricopeptide (TPR) repeat protein